MTHDDTEGIVDTKHLLDHPMSAYKGAYKGSRTDTCMCTSTKSLQQKPDIRIIWQVQDKAVIFSCNDEDRFMN
jgi:hypothetical protein